MMLGCLHAVTEARDLCTAGICTGRGAWSGGAWGTGLPEQPARPGAPAAALRAALPGVPGAACLLMATNLVMLTKLALPCLGPTAALPGAPESAL